MKKNEYGKFDRLMLDETLRIAEKHDLEVDNTWSDSTDSCLTFEVRFKKRFKNG